jgi:hypothetical protein|tara:strand:- start:139 stop:348 length:210 start_codon:yes stop_codon:yes gene_type:complete
MGGGAPAPPPVPKDPSPPPDRNEEEVKAAQTLERRKQLQERGRASTVLTSARGLGAIEDTNLAKKTLGS